MKPTTLAAIPPALPDARPPPANFTAPRPQAALRKKASYSPPRRGRRSRVQRHLL